MPDQGDPIWGAEERFAEAVELGRPSSRPVDADLAGDLEIAEMLRALGPSLRQVRPFVTKTTPVIKNQLRPFSRAALPTVRQLRPALNDLSAATPSLTRDPNEIERLTGRLLDYVKGNAGQRIEQIAAGMGTVTKELNLPVKKLIAQKSLKTKGQKRATQSFAR